MSFYVRIPYYFSLVTGFSQFLPKLFLFKPDRSPNIYLFYHNFLRTFTISSSYISFLSLSFKNKPHVPSVVLCHPLVLILLVVPLWCKWSWLGNQETTLGRELQNLFLLWLLLPGVVILHSTPETGIMYRTGLWEIN